MLCKSMVVYEILNIYILNELFLPFHFCTSVSLYPEFNYTVTHISKHIHCSPLTAQCSGIKVC